MVVSKEVFALVLVVVEHLLELTADASGCVGLRRDERDAASREDGLDVLDRQLVPHR